MSRPSRQRRSGWRGWRGRSPQRASGCDLRRPLHPTTYSRSFFFLLHSPDLRGQRGVPHRAPAHQRTGAPHAAPAGRTGGGGRAQLRPAVAHALPVATRRATPAQRAVGEHAPRPPPLRRHPCYRSTRRRCRTGWAAAALKKHPRPPLCLRTPSSFPHHWPLLPPPLLCGFALPAVPILRGPPNRPSLPPSPLPALAAAACHGTHAGRSWQPHRRRRRPPRPPSAAARPPVGAGRPGAARGGHPPRRRCPPRRRRRHARGKGALLPASPCGRGGGGGCARRDRPPRSAVQ